MTEFKPEVDNNEEIQIDLARLFDVLKQKLVFILSFTFLCVLIFFLLTNFVMTKKYQSKASIYLKPEITEAGIIDNATLSANMKMVNNYVLMLKGDTLLTDVASQLGIKNPGVVKKAISVSNVEDSEIIVVTATTSDPTMSRDIVKTTVNSFFASMKEKLAIKNMTILDEPKVPTRPVSPSLMKNLILGALFGIFVSCGLVIVEFLLDKRLHSKEDVESYLEIPVLAEIPWSEEA